MSKQLPQGGPRYQAHESERALALNGLPLATSWQRLLGFFVDLLLAVVVWFPVEVSWRLYVLHEHDIKMTWDFHEMGNILIMLF